MSGLHLPIFIMLIAYGIRKGFSFPQNMRHDHVNMRELRMFDPQHAQLSGKYEIRGVRENIFRKKDKT